MTRSSSPAATEVPAGIAAVDAPSRAALERAFNELLTAHWPALSRLASSYANRGDRDDLLQEIAIALWRALPQFRGECSLRTFAFRIAHNRCITHLSRRRTALSLDELDSEPVDGSAAPESDVSVHQDRQRLLRAIRRLPAIYREVVILMLEGLEYREIADVVGISETNVGVRLNRARRRLKRLIGEE